jgi:hypothetical protein
VAASIGGSHVLLAAVEGVLTAAILAAVLRLRPDMVRALRHEDPAPPPAPAPPPPARLGAGRE